MTSKSTHDLVTLNVELREALTALEKLAAFKTLFEEMCDPLMKAVQAFHGGRWEPEGTVLNPVVVTADTVRLQLAAMQSQVFPHYAKEPLGKLLRTSLRTDSRALRQLFGEVAAVEETFGEPVYLVSLGGFDRTLAECRSLLDERRHELDADVRRLTATIEETERQQGKQREHELALAETRASASFKAKLKKGAWWLFGGSVRKAILWGLTILVAIVAGYLFGPKAKALLQGSAASRDTLTVTAPPARPPTR